jgi:hypothetical protein
MLRGHKTCAGRRNALLTVQSQYAGPPVGTFTACFVAAL